jgi:hypothetical protein
VYYFYIIVSVGGRVGFGITKNYYERNKQYASHSGDIVSFVRLYAGSETHANALESIIKKQYVDNLWWVDDWKTEWLNKDISLKVFEKHVEDLIQDRHMKLKLLVKDYDFTQELVN